MQEKLYYCQDNSCLMCSTRKCKYLLFFYDSKKTNGETDISSILNLERPVLYVFLRRQRKKAKRNVIKDAQLITRSF